jgi:hypothetical protein
MEDLLTATSPRRTLHRLPSPQTARHSFSGHAAPDPAIPVAQSLVDLPLLPRSSMRGSFSHEVGRAAAPPPIQRPERASYPRSRRRQHLLLLHGSYRTGKRRRPGASKACGAGEMHLSDVFKLLLGKGRPKFSLL